MALYACRQETNQEADQISAAEDHAHINHRHGKELIRNGPEILNYSAEFAERHGRGQQPCGETDGEEMKELIAYVGPGSAPDRRLFCSLYLRDIDQQMNQSSPLAHYNRAR